MHVRRRGRPSHCIMKLHVDGLQALQSINGKIKHIMNQSTAGAGGLGFIRGKNREYLSKDIILMLNSFCNDNNSEKKNKKKKDAVSWTRTHILRFDRPPWGTLRHGVRCKDR